jgi:hypothetical protein
MTLGSAQSRPKHEKPEHLYLGKTNFLMSQLTFDDRFVNSVAARVQPYSQIKFLFSKNFIKIHLHPTISTFPRSYTTSDSIFGISGSSHVQPCHQIENPFFNFDLVDFLRKTIRVLAIFHSNFHNLANGARTFRHHIQTRLGHAHQTMP